MLGFELKLLITTSHCNDELFGMIFMNLYIAFIKIEVDNPTQNWNHGIFVVKDHQLPIIKFEKSLSRYLLTEYTST